MASSIRHPLGAGLEMSKMGWQFICRPHYFSDSEIAHCLFPSLAFGFGGTPYKVRKAASAELVRRNPVEYTSGQPLFPLSLSLLTFSTSIPCLCHHIKGMRYGHSLENPVVQGFYNQ